MFDAVETHIHHMWTGNVGDGYDIAVLKLDRKAKEGLVLPRLGTGGTAIVFGEYMAATGWGMIESTSAAKALRVADRLPLLEQKRCEAPPNVTDAGSWICAGGQGQNICKGVRLIASAWSAGRSNKSAGATGDAGGPLLWADFPKGHNKKGNPRFDMVVGTASYGYAEDGSEQSSGQGPSVYTSVDYFLDWIEETIEGRPRVSEVRQASCRQRGRVSAASKRSGEEGSDRKAHRVRAAVA